jgi:integrase
MNNLRHSFASQHLISGPSPLEVSKLIGHADPGVTLAVYARWSNPEQSGSEAVMAGRISGAEKTEAAF